MDGISATLVGGAIGGLLGAIGTFLATLHQSRITANMKFRDAFLPTLHILKPLHVASKDDHSEMLIQAFPQHSIAVAQFKPFLSFGERDAFDCAWHTYYGYKGDKNDVYLEQYSEFSEEGRLSNESTTQLMKRLNSLAHDRILEILKFADS